MPVGYKRFKARLRYLPLRRNFKRKMITKGYYRRMKRHRPFMFGYIRPSRRIYPVLSVLMIRPFMASRYISPRRRMIYYTYKLGNQFLF